VPRSRDMAIFVRTTDDRHRTDKSIALPLLYMRAHRVTKLCAEGELYLQHVVNFDY
jgi:hypothetical protein